MSHPGWQAWQQLGQAVVAALTADLREVSAMDVFLDRGTSARAGFPLSCGRLPVALGNEVCLISQAQWDLYVSEFQEIQGA
jgi:hypothetical protein